MSKINLIQKSITFQGEIFSGLRCLLIRFRDCDRVVSMRQCPWCDTLDKMINGETITVEFDEIREIVDNQRCGLLITGGEPTYGDNFEITKRIIRDIDAKFYHVESNGFDLVRLIEETYDRSNVLYIYSPKIYNNKDLIDNIEKTKKLSKYDNVIIKAVYWGALIDKYIIEALNIFDNNKIFIMPKSNSNDELMKNTKYVINVAKKYKINFCTRIHLIHEFSE